MKRYSLRPAQAGDRDWLWSVKSQALRTYVEQTWGRWDEAEQRARFDDGLDAAEFQVISAEGIDVGYLSYRSSPEEIQLLNIMLVTEHQSRGLGSEVLRDMLAEARTCRQSVRLQVLRVNPAQRLYVRLGFKVVGETPTHLQMKWVPG